MRRRTSGRVAMATGVVLLGPLAAGPVLAADASVTIADFAFAPATVTISAGESVTWTNQDGTDHTATGSGFDTEALGTGESSTITFDTAGTFAYDCAIHPTMHGEVIVEAAAPAPTDAPTEAPTADSGGGGGTTITPAPTDTVAQTDTEPTDASTIVAALLAIAGVSMLIGTWWFDHRGRPGMAARRSTRPPDDGPTG